MHVANLAAAATFASAARPKTCTAVTYLSSPKSNIYCGTYGTLGAPELITPRFKSTQDECVLQCLKSGKCVSLAYNQNTSQCSLLRKPLIAQKYADKASASGVIHYNVKCVACANALTTTSTTSLSTSSIITSETSTSTTDTTTTTSAPSTSAVTSTSTISSSSSTTSADPECTSKISAHDGALSWSQYYYGSGNERDYSKFSDKKCDPDYYALYTDIPGPYGSDCDVLNTCASYTQDYGNVEAYYFASNQSWLCINTYCDNTDADYFDISTSDVVKAYGYRLSALSAPRGGRGGRVRAARVV